VQAGQKVVLDFGPAWAAAYKKAKAKVRLGFFLSFFKTVYNVCVHRLFEVQHNDIKYLPALSQIKHFTLEEKVSVTTGVGWMNGRCVGNIPAIQPAHGTGWPGLCLEVIMHSILQYRRYG